MTTEPDHVTGPHGSARRIPPASYTAEKPAGVDGWIITAPGYHPLWSQYALGVVSLADIPGVPAANKHRADVTHELHVFAVNPEAGPVDATAIGPDGVPYLTPVNVCEQFITTDDTARRLAFLCVRAVVDGLLNPETGDAPELIRATWSTAIRETLEHPNHPGPVQTDGGPRR
ncbi:hypothetical protein ACFUEN_29150 [Streptomyces griseorubiginosus]|uniref:hypothetical protein n=1 Tax=Streptomyces griseorubiginosus TaxID=67304 RepID=UPI00363AD484